MKKMLSFISVMLLIALVFSGCGSKKASDAGSENGSQAGPGGQRQFTRADIMGEVDSIKDNKVTLKIIEMPQFNRQRNNNSQQNGSNQNGQNNNRTYNNNGQGNQNNAQPNNRQGSNRNRGRNYTGETKTITVASDIPVTTMTRGNNGFEEKKIEVKDIKKGDILQIWYSDKSKGTISRISVGGFGGFGGNGFGRGNRNGGYNNQNGGNNSYNRNNNNNNNNNNNSSNNNGGDTIG